MLILSKNILKKKNELEFYDHYKDLFYLTLKNLDVKSLQRFSRILEKKLFKKNIFLSLEMVVLQQYQIIFYVILTKELS